MGFLICREEKKNLNTYEVKLLIIGISGFILATLSATLAIIQPIPILLKYATSLYNGSFLMEKFGQKIDALFVESYLFNMTNAERFLNGHDHNIQLHEVGPFTYQEIRVNQDMELDEAAETLRYSPKVTVKFRPDLSIDDPQNVNVTMPNSAFLGIASMMSSYSLFAKLPFTVLARRLQSKAVISTDAHTYLWGVEEPLIKFGNAALPGMVQFDKMGLLDRLYDENNAFNIEVSSNNEDKFSIKTLNGVRGLPQLDYSDPAARSKCNTFEDTYEGLGFPAGIDPSFKMRIWRNVLCRILEIDFVEERITDFDVRILAFSISNRTYNYSPDKECLCRGDVACYNGMSDISKCFIGLPLAISNAHFLDGEPRLFRKLEGLSPDPALHGSEFLVEPMSGLVFGLRFTVQVNLVINDVSYNNEASPFSNIVLPIGYFKIRSHDMPESFKQYFRNMCYLGPRILTGIEAVVGALGVLMVCWAARRMYWTSVICGATTEMEFTPVSTGEKDTKSQLPLINHS